MIVVAILFGWSVLAVCGALVLGRAVALSDERRSAQYDLAA